MPRLRRLRRLRCLLRVRRILPPLLRRGAFRLHDEVEDFIGRARSSTRPILVFVRLGDSRTANNFRIKQKMLTR